MTVFAGDRASLLRERAELFTGIDFVHVADRCDQTELHVFFVTDATQLTVGFSGAGALLPEHVLITRKDDASAEPLRVTEIVEVGGNQVQLDPAFGRAFLAVRVERPGGFGTYRIRLVDPLASEDAASEPFPRIDRVFNDVEFSFKAGCEQNLECAGVETICPPEEQVDFPVDYLARDFTSFRNALLDYAAQRYPQWSLPIEADVGTMLAEVFAALGDELSYVQDRYAREAFLETATQRRSLRKKARLMDFEVHDGRNASTWLELTIDGGILVGSGQVLAGTTVWSRSQGGPPIAFEVGLGLKDRTGAGPRPYSVHAGWNSAELVPYVLDDRYACLDVGAREVLVRGTLPALELLIGAEPPRRMLLATDPADASIPARRLVVTLESIEVLTDPLVQPVQTFTRIRWVEPLPVQLDQSFLRLSLNIVPATAGETIVAEFVARSDSADPQLNHAVVRQGPLHGLTRQRPSIVLFGLGETESRGLGFLGESLRTAEPEILLERLDDGAEWRFQRSLLGASSTDDVFTVEDGQWRRVRRFRFETQEYVHQDYASGAGYSLRFGDGEFGRVPPAGSAFRVTYRTGPGTRANLPAGTINARSRAEGLPGELPAFVAVVNNPLPVTNGVDPESPDEIRLLAPETYQAELLFALRPEDYGARAEDLDFVQKAQGTARWTGSWLSTFVAVDPLGASAMTETQLRAVENRMNCVRQAGRDVLVQQPRQVALDLHIVICVEKNAYPEHVLAQVRQVLLRGRDGARGFFDPDNFSFGTPLHRSALEAAIQSVPGVRSVRRMRVRLRGVRPLRAFDELSLAVAPHQVLRLDDDPTRPENGSLSLTAEGGT
jgi:hypothetical protein